MFNEKMELSMNVDDKYKGAGISTPFPWDQQLNKAVEFNMKVYRECGFIKELDNDETEYGKAHLNVVAVPDKRLRVTMDAREINQFFAPPR